MYLFAPSHPLTLQIETHTFVPFFQMGSSPAEEATFEGEVAAFSTKCLDHKSSLVLIESATPCYDIQVVGP